MLLLACTEAPVSDILLEGTLSATDPHAIVVELSEAALVVCQSATDTVSQALEGQDVLRGLLAETEYRCTAEAAGRKSQAITLTTLPLPEGFPEIKLTIPNPDAGYHLFHVSSLGDIQEDPVVERWTMILDAEARVRWHYVGLGGGDIDLSWVDGKILAGGYDGEGPFLPRFISLDHEQQIPVPEEFVVDEHRTFYAWSHDVEWTGDSFRGLMRILRDGEDDGSFAIVEVDLEGTLLWFWDSGEHPELGTPVGQEPWHPNAVWADEDFFYVSLRITSQVLGIDRKTGDIAWKLGMDGDFKLVDPAGGELPDSEWFFNQHDAKFVEDRFYLFDNGSMRSYYSEGPSYSRVVVLRLDADRVVLETAWTSEGFVWYDPIWGGVDPIPGGLSVAASAVSWLDPADTPSRLFQLDEAGTTETWAVEFPDLQIALYRSEWLEHFP
jgi:hypothetical protein